MRIDGKAIADQILDELARKVTTLKEKGIIPTLAVILVGNNPASLSYIKQKQKAAERIGARLVLKQFAQNVSLDQINLTIQQFNNDPSVHGLIVQQPLPKLFAQNSSLHSVIPTKDVDGFVPNSPFEVPVAMAVGEILQEIYKSANDKSTNKKTDYLSWLRSKNMVIIGRGETAGAPILAYFNNLQCTTSQVHSQTPNPTEITRPADIIISCVGKEQVVRREMVKPGAILIGVGLWRDAEEKLHGDYDEEDIGRIASFHTPTPGGVGPINVACLLKNLVAAAQR